MNPEEIGPWKRIRVLGSGGFGQVTLWYNPKTDEKIAIKKLHEKTLKEECDRVKQTERWCKEVEIMKKLNHPNIVATLEVPDEFKMLTSHQSLLAMEYCSEGDLRGVLNKPENCNGLREPEILNVLKDVSNGLAYLHTCKIIHRDLKPDNIVLMKKESKVVYKLIDLGYAKALDQSSLSQSFVGTVQYIAPELFMGKAYTSSVDYWSFGLVAHEIVTGFRPFLPGFSPSDWMRQIKNKDRNVICAFENPDGEIIFSSSVSRKNHASRVFLKHFEKWLQIALDWDGQTRGREPDRNRPVIFEELGNILCKKVVKVFSLPTYETLSYEITKETDISDLSKWIRDEIDLEIDDQILVLPNGKTLSARGNLLQTLKTDKAEDEADISLYLFNGGTITIRNESRDLPKYARELVANGNRMLRYRHLKRSCSDAVYFLQKEAIRYHNLLQGIGVKINSTKQKTLAIEALYEDVNEEWSQIESFSQFMSLSHKIDLENYIQFRKSGKLKASPQVQKWIQNVTEVDKKINELKKSFNKNEQRQLVLVARQRCRYLDSHPGNECILEKTPLDDILNEGQKLWEKIQKVPKGERENSSSNAAAVALIKRAAEESNKLVDSQMLGSLFEKISEADENLGKFLTRLTAMLNSTKILKLLIENTQKERQMNVWNMLMNERESAAAAAAEEERNGGKGVAEAEAVEGRRTNGGSDGGSSAPENLPAKLFPKETHLKNWKSFDHELDASSIIRDNNQLRHKIQEVQQICDQMVNQMRSQNLNSFID